VSSFNNQELILKAAIEFGSLYTYEISYGTLGKTLYIDAENKSEARDIRRIVSDRWNGLYVIVRYIESDKITHQKMVRKLSAKEKLKQEELKKK